MPFRQYENGMQKVSVQLPDNVMIKLEEYARKRNIKLSKAVRDIVTKAFGLEADK